jgi:uncharacterized protein
VRAVLSALVVCAVLLGGGAAGAVADERLPPPPKAYFNDYAGLVPAADAVRLDARLREFEKQTSTQVLVAIFPELPSPSLEDFTNRTAESWRVGREDVDNGAVFFVFVRDRRMRIETGYGLEGALPDALANRILNDEVVPRFRTGDFPGGVEAGIDAILRATRGEYQPVARKSRGGVPLAGLVVVLFFVLLFLWLAQQGSNVSGGGRTYDRRGYRRGGWGGGSSWGGGGFPGGGGSWGGGGAGFGGGGGFSGGGGSFGGGGASGSW